MSKTRSENIKLGAFVILGTACLIIAIYLIGSKQNLFGGTFELKAVFNNVNGLQQGNNVRFAGITVGTVNKIEMKRDTLITVHMVIEDDMLEHIRKDAIATIGSDGLVGSMLINITPQAGRAALVQSGDEIRSNKRLDTEEMLSTLGTSNDNIAVLTRDLMEITRSLNNGEGALGHLLKDTLMGDELAEVMYNLKLSSRSLTSALDDVNKELSTMRTDGGPISVLLHDSVSGRLLQQSIADLQNASLSIKTVGQDMESVISRIEQGGGAIDLLSTDTTFAQKLDSTMINLQKGSLLLNQDLEALQHNFLFRRYFKKQKKQSTK